ncbi:magnesium transporter CorA family protein [Acidaminobacter sp.]|uniref:magnesium transporter CorA family protein n=1 Tax=Acidaminobacter sp. TaxID=1872102 RepID=UPI001385E4A3|nr:magnesium transporter CorA family protein [Acidaminobacter sp.]MDK9709855.1 magnesium transporter CorA family protein [Acidaminobacter sp.]MZQ96640.1 magnesium transporter CorA family protein [Acidaminobacter sp.]
MIQIFKTIGEKLETVEMNGDGCWIHMTAPTEQELQDICRNFPDMDPTHLRAALDEEERARIEIEPGSTLILVDVPMIEPSENNKYYNTLPLGIILAGDSIITVCTQDVPLIKDFAGGSIRSFYTFKKTRFILQVLYKNASYYLMFLKQIDRRSSQIERELHKSMKNKELIQLLELEKSLVYFSTSLRANEVVLERMLRLDAIKKYPEDEDLLEDVIIENKQAIEMATIYSNILSGTMDAFASVISNNLNIVMKLLTSITIVMAIPTMIASFFGMNVPVPLEGNAWAFVVIIMMTVGLAVLSTFVMWKKKLF